MRHDCILALDDGWGDKVAFTAMVDWNAGSVLGAALGSNSAVLSAFSIADSTKSKVTIDPNSSPEEIAKGVYENKVIDTKAAAVPSPSLGSTCWTRW